jgi:uncharacterized protein involved in exopolysaccharide biosynthesis
MAIGTVVAVGSWVFNTAKGIYEYAVTQKEIAEIRGAQDTTNFSNLQTQANAAAVVPPKKVNNTPLILAGGVMAIAAILVLTKGK